MKTICIKGCFENKNSAVDIFWSTKHNNFENISAKCTFYCSLSYSWTTIPSVLYWVYSKCYHFCVALHRRMRVDLSFHLHLKEIVFFCRKILYLWFYIIVVCIWDIKPRLDVRRIIRRFYVRYVCGLSLLLIFIHILESIWNFEYKY